MYALAGASSGVHPHQVIEPLSAAPLFCVSVFAPPAQPASASAAAVDSAAIPARWLLRTRLDPNICLSWRSVPAVGAVGVREALPDAGGGRDQRAAAGSPKVSESLL